MQNYIEIHCSEKIHILEAIPLVILLGMTFISVPTGIIKNQRGFKYLIKSSLFSLLPLIGILVNTYIIPLYGVYPFQPYCLVVGVLLAYLFMVEHQQNQVESAHREKLSCALEMEKEATKKAKEAGAVKNTFLANMSHDIRTPMNAILGFSNIIADHPDDEQIVKTAITKIQASGDVLMKLINDVLDLSKIESGKLTLNESATSLEQMGSDLKTMMEYSMQKKSIDFTVINHMKNPYVWCDTTKLQQVLVNILNNAVKFTPSGGKITLTYDQISVNSDTAQYKIAVKDNGIGMDEEFQKHAFEAFEREHTSTESQTEGTGLGLAIVQRLVELMHGQVTIHSKPQKGTEISIIIPLKLATEEQVAPSFALNPADMNLSNVHALLVEDNELNAEIAIETLKCTELSIDWVKNGKSCIHSLEEHDTGYYQFILMDIQMPVMNGYETTRAIRQMPDSSKSQIPILAMTANAFDDDRRAATEAGMNGFIAKPIEVDKMMQTILEILPEERRTL